MVSTKYQVPITKGIATGNHSQQAVVIELDLPPRCLSPNARAHYFTRASAVKRYRTLAMWCTVEAMAKAGLSTNGCHWQQVTVQCTFRFAQRRRRDKDNLLASMKAAFDGIADSGLVVDDSAMTHLPVEISIDPTRPSQVIVTIAPQEVARG